MTFGWTLTDAATIADERLRGAVEQLDADPRRRSPRASTGPSSSSPGRRRPLDPWGRALFAGTLSQALPGDPLGDLFRLGDRLREYRGDSHIAAWVAAGFDAAEIGLLTELYWGMPSRTYVRTRAWSDADLDAAEARLEAAGLMADHQLTDAGRARREEIELVTDAADAARPRRARRRPRRARRAAHPLGPGGHGGRRLPRQPPRHQPCEGR